LQKSRRAFRELFQENAMTLTTLLIILLVLILIGALPVYPYSRSWGYYPSGLLAVVVAVVALMLLL
jgi:Protein of unknown function (DUF3309)